MFRSDILLGCTFVVLGAVIVAAASLIEPLQHIPYGPGIFPTLVGSGMVLFGAEVAWNGRRGVPAEPNEKDAEAETNPALLTNPVVATAGFLIVPILFVLLVPRLGFLIAMPLLIGGLIGILSRRWVMAAVAGIVITLLMHGIFQGVLKVPLPWGLLESWSGVLTWM
jgi:putative tricarboxylic transport membrane protein